MIIFRKIFSTLVPKSRTPLITTLFVPFCERSQIRKLVQMHTVLLENCQRLQSEKIIKLMHVIHFKSVKQAEKSLLTPQSMQAALQSLSSQIHKLSHEDLTLLLQTMSQIKGYKLYNRNLDVMRLLAKRINSINILPLSQKFKFRFIHVLEKMQFPHNVILKYVNSLLKTEKKGKQEKMLVIDALRIFITLLEMNYVHPRLVSQFYYKQIKKIKINHPRQMVYLFYICKILQKSLQKKIVYIIKKQKFTTLVSSPYPVESQTQSDTNSLPPQSQTQEQYISKQTKKLQELSLSLIQQIRKQIDINKLTKNICKHYEFEKFPLDSSTSIFLLSLSELHPTLAQHFEKNYKTMSINEFCLLLPIAREQVRHKLFEEYKQLVWKHITFTQKLTLLKLKAEKLNQFPAKQDLLTLLHQTTSISIKQFELISILSSTYLPENEQLEIINTIQSIIGDQSTQK